MNHLKKSAPIKFNVVTTISLLMLILPILTSCSNPLTTNSPSTKDAAQDAAQTVRSPSNETLEVVLGAMFPLTGDGAAYGEPLSRQLQIAVDELNAAGGIAGKKVRIILEDSKCNPKDGANAANKLINIDKVKVIFGGACSGETLGAAPIAEQNKVILLSPSATSPDLTTAGDYIFRTAPSDANAGGVAAEVALDEGFETAAIINENTDYAQGLRRVFDKVFTEGGGKIVAVESYNPDEADFKTHILKIKEKDPDLIYIVPQAPPKGVLLIKQLHEQGLTSQLMTAEVLIGRDVVKEHGKEMEGLVGIEQAFDEKGALAQQSIGAYRTKYGEPPYPFYQAATRDALYLITDAIKEYGLDTEKIKKKLYETKDWDGAVGKLTIDEHGDALVGYSVKEVRDGKLVELEPTENEEAEEQSNKESNKAKESSQSAATLAGKEVVVESKV